MVGRNTGSDEKATFPEKYINWQSSVQSSLVRMTTYAQYPALQVQQTL
jgi:hypothetical protein